MGERFIVGETASQMIGRLSSEKGEFVALVLVADELLSGADGMLAMPCDPWDEKLSRWRALAEKYKPKKQD